VRREPERDSKTQWFVDLLTGRTLRSQVLGPIVWAGMALVLTACPGSPPAPMSAASASAGATGAPTVVANPSLAYTPAPDCPVTIPGSTGPPGVSAGALFGSQSSYGNQDLWVGAMGPGGVIVSGPTGVKLGWWRFAEGRLVITGRRLDGTAPPLRSSVPDGYGSSGFQASGVEFPTGGCWEITGAVGGGRLTFVTYVIKVG
jgi:hypothetical protein